MNDDGWRRARDFASENPGEQLGILANKLRLTYLGDGEGADLVRGFFGRDNWHLNEVTWRRLVWIADAWWAAMSVLVVIGATRFRGWPAATRTLVLSLLGTWLALHLVFMGGARFHHPEILIYAMIAGVGLRYVLERLRTVLGRGSKPYESLPGAG
jgi:hypothetical protein